MQKHTRSNHRSPLPISENPLTPVPLRLLLDRTHAAWSPAPPRRPLQSACVPRAAASSSFPPCLLTPVPLLLHPPPPPPLTRICTALLPLRRRLPLASPSDLGPALPRLGYCIDADYSPYAAATAAQRPRLPDSASPSSRVRLGLGIPHLWPSLAATPHLGPPTGSRLSTPTRPSLHPSLAPGAALIRPPGCKEILSGPPAGGHHPHRISTPMCPPALQPPLGCGPPWPLAPPLLEMTMQLLIQRRTG